MFGCVGSADNEMVIRTDVRYPAAADFYGVVVSRHNCKEFGLLVEFMFLVIKLLAYSHLKRNIAYLDLSEIFGLSP